jgi:hypothetical protein
MYGHIRPQNTRDRRGRSENIVLDQFSDVQLLSSQ